VEIVVVHNSSVERASMRVLSIYHFQMIHSICGTQLYQTKSLRRKKKKKDRHKTRKKTGIE
jgi:hypothetical protein